MKAIQIARTGGPDVLQPVEMPMPSPGPGEVLVKAQAIGVNYFDTLIRTGRYRWMPKLPFVPGNEMSGRVEALGSGVRHLAIGQRVFVAGYEIGNRGGLYAEYAAVPEAAAWPLPDAVGADEATALTNYQLAWILLHHAARGIELVRARGATHALDHRTESITERVLALTDGRGADIVFDHIAGRSLIESVRMVAPLGMVVSYAALGGLPDTDLFAAMRSNIEKSPAVRCFTMHTYDHMEEPRREAMTRAVALLADGAARPVIAACLPLAEAHRAHSLIEQRTAMGKIILKP
ncbi:MAG: zinc-binding dehydrogenase [Rhizobiales bacterium]|nr:zinc-binding dehydrogenase [Hyphomicrobiales bacterium]